MSLKAHNNTSAMGGYGPQNLLDVAILNVLRAEPPVLHVLYSRAQRIYEMREAFDWVDIYVYRNPLHLQLPHPSTESSLNTQYTS